MSNYSTFEASVWEFNEVLASMMRFVRTIATVVSLAGALWLASGLRWPGFSDPDGDWFRLVSQLSATVLGAGIAASVTWYFASRKVADERRAALTRLFLKLVQMAGGMRNTTRTIDEMLSDANSQGNTHLPLWARVLPITGLPTLLEIDVSDMVPLIDVGETKIVDDVILLEQRNRSMLAALATYNELRLQLRDRMPVSRQFGKVSTTELSEDQLAELAPRFSELDDIITNALTHLRVDVDFAKSLLERFHAAAAKVTKKPFPTVRHVD